jgi:two-component system, OmpR family, phosphate regulon response regulator OmpR
MIQVHMIDDDEEMHDLLSDYFADEAITFTASPTPSKGLEYVRKNRVDLVLLDFMMPEMDGFEACRQLRAYNPLLPIIMLTAKKDDYNRIVGLELGADDYISKPFNPRELLARIKTIMRRFERSQQYFQAAATENNLLSEAHALVMNLDSRQVLHHGESLDLTTTEFDMLHCLLENAGIVLTRDALMSKVRGLEFDAFDRTIDVFVSRLRQKLGDNPRKPEIIKTIRGVGYLFTK